MIGDQQMHASKKLTKLLAGNATMRDMYILNLLNVHAWAVT